MWLKVILCVGLIGSVISLHNPPLSTKWRPETLSDPILTPFIDNPPRTYRLPNDSFPLEYSLELKTDIDEGKFEFSGRAMIKIQMRVQSTEIVIHSKQQNILKIDLYDQDIINRDATNLTFYKIESHDFLVIDLQRTKRVNEQFWLDIYYTAELRDGGEGFYRGSYVNEQNQTVWYATTQFEIYDARHAFPCYDEPGIRAPIKLAISYKEPFTAVANMPPITTFPDSDPNYKKTLFQTTPPMQTYLLAFLISDYKFKEAPTNSTRIPQYVYAIPKAINDGWADYAASIAGAVVRELEKFIGFEYPLPKLDHVALTYFIHGAMENFGLITYRDNALLMDPMIADQSRHRAEQGVIGIIAHETAHQWFGDIISPTWWSYTWLNEGFATLFTNVIQHKVYPERNLMKNFIRSNLPAAFSTDDSNSTWSMNHYTEEPSQLWNKFGNIGYSKAGCVLRMFMESISEETFAKGLKYYMEDNTYKAVTPDAIHSALQKAYNEDGDLAIDIGALMGTWENQAGYPLVSIRINGNNLELSQTRFPFTNGELYSIPLTWNTKASSNFERKTADRWMTGATLSIPFLDVSFASGDWIILNTQQVGYYKVDYSTELWRAIINQLKTDHTQIHPINRAVLQDELLIGWKNFARINAADILDSLLYFSVEDEAISWSKAGKFLSELELRLSGSEIYEKFQEFVKDLTNPGLTTFGYEGIGVELTEMIDLRNNLASWNCRALDGDCILHEYTKWSLYNSLSASAPFNLCYASTIFDVNSFNQILDAITTDRNYPLRSSYLQNLGCNRDATNLRSFLDASIDLGNNLNEQERLNILRNVISSSTINQFGLETAMTFIDQRHENISALNDREFIPTISRLAQYVNPSSLVNFIRLRDKLSNAGYLSAAEVTNVNTVVQATTSWHNSNYETIRAWFEGYTEPVTTTSTSTTTTTTTTTTSTTTTTTQPPPSSSSSSPRPIETTTPSGASSIQFASTFLLLCSVLSLILMKF